MLEVGQDGKYFLNTQFILAILLELPKVHKDLTAPIRYHIQKSVPSNFQLRASFHLFDQKSFQNIRTIVHFCCDHNVLNGRKAAGLRHCT